MDDTYVTTDKKTKTEPIPVKIIKQTFMMSSYIDRTKKENSTIKELADSLKGLGYDVVNTKNIPQVKDIIENANIDVDVVDDDNH